MEREASVETKPVDNPELLASRTVRKKHFGCDSHPARGTWYGSSSTHIHFPWQSHGLTSPAQACPQKTPGKREPRLGQGTEALKTTAWDEMCAEAADLHVHQ